MAHALDGGPYEANTSGGVRQIGEVVTRRFRRRCTSVDRSINNLKTREVCRYKNVPGYVFARNFMAPGASSVVRPRVLVIERDVTLQKRLAVTLAESYSVDLTSSGSLALLLMKDYRYACILASYHLPNRHCGSGILQAVRSMPGGRYVPVIATGTDSPEDIGQSVESEGFAAWLRLSDDPHYVISTINDIVNSWD